MDVQNFIELVAELGGLTREDAEQATRATLEALGERLSEGEARDLGERLPNELRPLLIDGSRAKPFGLDEFLRRVAEREGVEIETARAHARAVFGALGRAVGLKEIHDAAAQLPREFRELVAEAERQALDGEHLRRRTVWKGRVPADEFLRRVAERAGLDLDQSRRATEAVLEALAERISGGEVDDLEQELPPELHPPLERGKAESHGAAEPLSLDQFLRLIARNERATPWEAREHARAVFATLHETIGEKEFHDVVAQLPKEYKRVLA